MAGDTIRFLSMTNNTVKYHLEQFEGISAALQGYTKNCVISFLDLYQKVKRNFPEVKMVSKEQRKYLGQRMTRIATEHKMILRPCGEGTELAAFGADCNGCMTQQIYENAIHMSRQCLRDGAKALILLGFLDRNVKFTPYLHLWKIGSE